MKLIKDLNEKIKLEEDVMEFSDMSLFFDKNGDIINESITSFITGAKAMIDRPVINVNNTKFDDKDRKVPGDENNDGVFDDGDIVLRFARILAGLEYFRRKNIDADEKQSVQKLGDDKSVTTYIKSIGKDKAKDIVKEIMSYFADNKIKNKPALEKMIENIRKFYAAKKANVGPVLNVEAFENHKEKQVKKFEKMLSKSK